MWGKGARPLKEHAVQVPAPSHLQKQGHRAAKAGRGVWLPNNCVLKDVLSLAVDQNGAE